MENRILISRIISFKYYVWNIVRKFALNSFYVLKKLFIHFKKLFFFFMKVVIEDFQNNYQYDSIIMRHCSIIIVHNNEALIS